MVTMVSEYSFDRPSDLYTRSKGAILLWTRTVYQIWRIEVDAMSVAHHQDVASFWALERCDHTAQ